MARRDRSCAVLLRRLASKCSLTVSDGHMRFALRTHRYTATQPVVDFTVGYAYAIATTSATVLQYLKNECFLTHGANSALCTYTIAYPGAIAGARRF